MPTINIASLVLDIALIAVIVGTVLYYAKRGFLAGLLDLIGNLAALLLAWLASGKLSTTVFENFFKSNLITKTAETIQAQGGLNLNTLLDSLSGILPQRFIDNILSSADGLLDTSAPNIAQQVVEHIMAPLIMPLIGVAVFFVAFLLGKLLVSFLVAVLTNVNHIPLVGGANKMLGVLLGVVSGGINALLVLCAIWAVVGITSSKLPIVNDQTLSNSFFYSQFSEYNPFL